MDFAEPQPLAEKHRSSKPSVWDAWVYALSPDPVELQPKISTPRSIRPSLSGVSSRFIAQTCPPLLWVLRAMKDRVNDDGIGCQFVKDLVREASHQRTAKVIHRDRIDLGMPLNGEDTRLHATKEIFAESRLAALIPVVGLCDISVSLLGKDDSINHPAPALDASLVPMCVQKPDAPNTAPCGGEVHRASSPSQVLAHPPARCCPTGLRQAEDVRRVRA